MNVEFVGFPKIARLSRDVIVTEKIDGTNAQVFIVALEGFPAPDALYQRDRLALYAGSRTRWITPKDDNHGFAAWCLAHADELLTLGPGRHFGDWWGSGIQRGYGLQKGEKRFSLFNVTRWCLHGQTPGVVSKDEHGVEKRQDVLPECVGLVPVLWRGIFDTPRINGVLDVLASHGSHAAPGFMNPEGIVIFHVAGNVGFKKTILKDDEPKGRRTEPCRAPQG
jgi:hypothetical protein